MTFTIFLAAITGAFLCAAIDAAIPTQPGLHATIGLLNTTTIAPASTPTVLTGPLRVAGPAVGVLRRAGLPRAGVHPDLEICDRDPGEYLATLVLAALGGALTPLLLLAGSGPVLLVVCTACGAAGGAALVHGQLRTAAAARRADLRHALSVLLDLTVIALSGGAGVEQALTEASTPRLGPSGWATRRLHTAIVAAARAHVDPWRTLAQLGADTGVTALLDLATSIRLSGTEGAVVRDSLTARADTLRDQLAAAGKADTRAASQRLVIPLMVMALAYLIFLLYPAIENVAASL